MNARDELAELIGEAADGWLMGPSVAGTSPEGVAADAVLAAGYEKPRIIGYVVVGRDGSLVQDFDTDRAAAQKFADQWTADCKTVGTDWDYRVAAITEAAA